MMFALGLQRHEEINLSKMLIGSVSFLLLLALFEKNKQKKSKLIFLTVILDFVIYIACYFDPTKIDRYRTDFPIKSIKDHVNNHMFYTIIIPIIIIGFFLKRINLFR